MVEDMLTKVYSEPPPEVLYHYTTQAGLLGILEKQEIWATHTQYLNDHTEYLHAVKMVQDRLDFLIKQNRLITPVFDNELLESMRDGLYGIQGQCVCVFSLSNKKDSLSQWRAYGGENGGFAIGISAMTLDAMCNKHSLKLGKCIYEIDEQQLLVEQLVDAMLKEAQRLRKAGTPWRDEIRKIMTNCMNRYAPLLKHKSFSEEEEWRLISGPIAPFASGLKFRTGISTLVPYYPISLEVFEGKKFIPETVVVGPTPKPDEAAHSVRLLLVRRGMEEWPLEKVEVSNVPYRSW